MGNLPYITSTVADARILLILLAVVVVLLLWHWLIQVGGVLASINLILEGHRIIIVNGSWRKIPQPPPHSVGIQVPIAPTLEKFEYSIQGKVGVLL